LKYASKNLKEDREIAMVSVSNCGDAFEFVSDKLHEDKELAIIAMKKSHDYYQKLNDSILKFAPIELQNDPHINELYSVLTEIKKGGGSSAAQVLKNASKTIQSDKTVLLLAVSWDANALEYASKELQEDEEIVLLAIKHIGPIFGDLLNNVSSKLLEDRKFLIKALSTNGFLLSQLTDEQRNDKELVLAAINQYGATLEYASDELRANKEVVMKAVHNDCAALQYASVDLQKDREIVIEAVNQVGDFFFFHGLQYSEEELENVLSDKEIVMTAVKKNGMQLKEASNGLKADYDIVRAAILQNNEALKLASPELQANPELKKIAKWCKI
jgi:hypothetical protein